MAKMIEMTNQEKAELCEGIVEKLEQYGHCRGKFQDADGQVCLLGAGQLVLLGKTQEDKPTFWINSKIAHALGFDRPSLVVWRNDGLDGDRGLNKETAIEYAMKMAKHWRELG